MRRLPLTKSSHRARSRTFLAWWLPHVQGALMKEDRMTIQPVTDDRPDEWDPCKGTYLGAAWRAAAAILRDGQWYYTYDLYVVMCEESGLPMNRVASRIKGAVRHGYLERERINGIACVRVTEKGRTRPELRQDSE